MDRMSPEGYRDESPASAYEASKACIEHIRKIDPHYDLITPVITPRFAPSCTREVLAELGRLHHESGCPAQTHVSENLAECAMVAELFPESNSYTHVYDQASLLTSRMILAHAVHLTEAEKRLIKARDTKLSHCPASNTSLTSGRAKVRKLLDEGITVGLGTDVSGGYTSSILAEAREAIMVSRHVAMDDGDEAKLTLAEVLYLATRGGAKCVGMEDRIGGFEVGKEWDAQMVMLDPVGDTIGLDPKAGVVDFFGGETWSDKLEKWVFCGDDRNTHAVWVKGRLVHSRETFKP